MIKIDSRNFKFYQKFGQTTFFETELIFDSSKTDFIQPIGDVRCTAITVCETATDKTNKTYDFQELFSRIPNDSQGANPKDAIKQGIEYLITDGNKEKVFNSYWEAHTGNFDAFDNVRSAIQIAQNSITIWIPWYYEWANKQILTEGQSVLGYHMCQIEGWKLIDDVPMLQIEAYVGYKLYISRELFNSIMKKWATGSAVLSDSITDLKRKKTLLETLVDAYKNLIILIQQSTIQKPQPIANIKPSIKMNDKLEELYIASKGYLNQHLTLNPTVPKDVGCAQAMSFVLKSLEYPIPKGGISGTYTLCEWLEANFKEVKTPSVGSIIIYVTGTGKKGTHGHVGVYGIENILSNNSSNGLWQAHWKIANFKKYYESLGMPVRYFNPQ